MQSVRQLGEATDAVGATHFIGPDRQLGETPSNGGSLYCGGTNPEISLLGAVSHRVIGALPAGEDRTVRPQNEDVPLIPEFPGLMVVRISSDHKLRRKTSSLKEYP